MILAGMYGFLAGRRFHWACLEYIERSQTVSVSLCLRFGGTISALTFDLKKAYQSGGSIRVIGFVNGALFCWWTIDRSCGGHFPQTLPGNARTKKGMSLIPKP